MQIFSDVIFNSPHVKKNFRRKEYSKSKWVTTEICHGYVKKAKKNNNKKKKQSKTNKIIQVRNVNEKDGKQIVVPKRH